ncbi:hypothetical protein HanPI659440_Chr17g0687741 [Helianthus annuus]|nr:hypothetical protein HanPI659440_Chr17g0687741 [Helianthus annuus]
MLSAFAAICAWVLRPSFHVSRGVKRCWFLGPLLPGLHFAVDREE